MATNNSWNSQDPVQVALGGTGAATLTGLLTGNGTSAVTGTAITQYNVITGGATNLPNSVAPGATSGVPLISQGSSSQPIFGTALVGGGGTGQTSLTNHGVLVGAGSSAITQLAVGTTGQVLTGSSSADPSFASIGTNSGLTQYGVVLAENTGAFQASNAATNGQVLLGATSANPAFASLTSTGGTIAFTTGTNSLNLDVVSAGLPWTNVTGTSQAMSVNNGYIANNASLVTLTLPSTAALGTQVKVAGLGAGGWKIAQNAGQLINFGSVVTTTGATGFLSSTNTFDQIDLLCVTANTTWVVRSSIGNITYN